MYAAAPVDRYLPSLPPHVSYYQHPFPTMFATSSTSEQKRELRPMIAQPSRMHANAVAPTGARPAQAVPPGTSTLAGAILLAVIIVFQLIAISNYPSSQPVDDRPLPACDAKPPVHPSETLSLIQSSQPTAAAALPSSEHALNTVKLLQKFLRMKRPIRAHTHDASHHGPSDAHPEEYLLEHTDMYHAIWLNISDVWARNQLAPDHNKQLSSIEQANARQCIEWGEEYGVKVDVSWGRLPEKYQAEFDKLVCSDILSLRETARYILDHPTEYNRVSPVPAQRQRPEPEDGMEEKVIAVVACVTTRGLKITVLSDLALFNHLLPSFMRTAEAGFEYWIYVGYDRGDPWMDDSQHRKMMRSWWDTHAMEALKARGVVAKLIFTGWDNPSNLPGPAFNHVTGVAYADGATWIYRVNDDQSFDTPWASPLVHELTAMSPPYGVVGPACAQGAQHILVVDFVHRTHHEIFPSHYPPSLRAQWMDNWITQVYGRKRTKRVPTVRVSHLTTTHGTRYVAGDNSLGQFYRGEMVRGRVMVEEYLSHTEGLRKVLEEYRTDKFAYDV